MITARIFLFTLGAGSGVFLPSLPPMWVILLAAIIAGGFLLHRYTVLPALFALGLCLSMLHLAHVVGKQLPVDLEGVDLPLTVEVIGLPESFGRNIRFLVRVVEGPAEVSWAGNMRLSWYHGRWGEAQEIKPGQIWQLTVRLKRPRGFVNPKGFDYHAWLLGNGIYATGYVRTKADYRKLSEPDSWRFSALRYHLSQQLFSDGGGLEYGDLLRALILGDRSGISQQQWGVLQSTGTIHLMAISGLHVGLVATLGFLLGGGIRRLFTLLVGSRPGMRMLPPVLSVGFAVVYAGLAGFSIPTQRALVFIVLINLACLLFRRVNLYHALAVCALVIVLRDPFAFLSPGFWLSFSAVLVLFYLFSLRAGKTSKLRGALVSQASLFVGMIAPLCLLVLPVSLSGPLANLVAVPVVSVVIIPALFAAVLVCIVNLPWALDVLAFADLVFGYLWRVLEFFASYEAVWRHTPVNGWAAMPVGLLAALLLLAPRGIPFRLAGAALLLVFLFPVRHEQEGLRLTTLDVGQGLALVLESPDVTLLYDTGARFSDNFDAGSRIISPYLVAHGHRQLDQVFISHADNDHAGGLSGILTTLKVKTVAAGQPRAARRQLRKLNLVVDDNLISDCHQGMQWVYGELVIDALWPADSSAGIKGDKTNNRSCVLLLRYGGQLILLPGDIEADVESALLKAGLLPKDVDILVAPHHGSRSSSSRAFVDQVSPDFIIYSAGYKNRYNHPHPDIVERYRQAGSAGYNTGTQGAVTFRLNPDGHLDVHYSRKTDRRPWYDRDDIRNN